MTAERDEQLARATVNAYAAFLETVREAENAGLTIELRQIPSNDDVGPHRYRVSAKRVTLLGTNKPSNDPRRTIGGAA